MFKIFQYGKFYFLNVFTYIYITGLSSTAEIITITISKQRYGHK